MIKMTAKGSKVTVDTYAYVVFTWILLMVYKFLGSSN